MEKALNIELPMTSTNSILAPRTTNTISKGHFFCKNEFDVEVSPDDASFTFTIDLVIDNKQNKVATVDVFNLSTSGWEAYSSPSPEPTPCLDGSAPQAR
jgi:hypothetical protein